MRGLLKGIVKGRVRGGVEFDGTGEAGGRQGESVEKQVLCGGGWVNTYL